MDTETRLMLEVRDGSREAFEELYARFRRPLANYLYRLCWDRGRVDDLLQEVLLRVWRAAPGYRPEAKVSTWIFRIAHNLWINESSKRREKPLGGADTPSKEGPGAEAERREAQEAVRKAVQALPEGEREVLVLAEYNGFRYREISDILDIPVGTVKSRMFSALQRLRKELEDRP